MLRRTPRRSPTTSNPATRAVPLSGRDSVARIRTVVVFPAPFAPSSENTVPSRHVQVNAIEDGHRPVCLALARSPRSLLCSPSAPPFFAYVIRDIA
jgi:hypothetical protein